MTQPDVPRDPEPNPFQASVPAPSPSRGAPTVHIPPHAWAWLLRSGAVVTFLAAVAGVLVAPGLRGLAIDRVVNRTNAVAWTLAYFMGVLLIGAILVASRELSRDPRTQGLRNGFAVSASGLVVALAAPAFVHPLPPLMSAAMALVASLVVVAGAIPGLRASHTRAVAALMLAMALAGLLRVAAWKLAEVAGDDGNTRLYATSRVVSTAAIAFEAIGQMIAAAWLGTRSRFTGQLLSSAAIGLAWVLTYGSARGASAGADSWQVGAHIALATATGLPRPYGWTALAPFLLAASIFLGGVASIQRTTTVPVVFALTLSLVARGSFDVPLHALAATAASLWVILAVADPRAFWQTLLASKAAVPAGPSTTAPVRPEG